MSTTIKLTMLGAFHTFITCCVFSSAAFAQQPQGRPKPARASTVVAWEYGEMFYIAAADKKSALWFGADTTLNFMLDSVAKQPPFSPDPVVAAFYPTPLQLLNALGAKGWELISMPIRSDAPYVFKRQLTPNK